MKLKSLRARLVLWTLLLLCLSQLIVSIFFFVASARWLQDQVDNSLLVTANQVLNVVVEDGAFHQDDVNFQLDSSNPALVAALRDQQFFVRLIDRNSGAILDTSSANTVAVTTAAQATTPVFETLNDSLRLYTLPIQQDMTYALQVGMSLDQMRSTEGLVLRLLVIAFAATALLAVASGWFIGNRALAPIHGITRTAQDISATDLTLRLDLRSSDEELAQLVETFNAMLDRIASAFQQQQQFTADAAHELRTPLSIMQTGLDVVLSQERTPDQLRAGLESAREEVQRLTRLANHLLTLARTDTRALPLNKQSVDLSLLLQTVLDQLAAEASHKQIEIRRSLPARLMLQADQDRLVQVALNLAENAIKYTPAGGVITVEAKATDGSVEFSLTNSGGLLSEYDLSHIFDRFYRIERSRNRDHGGFGLGLVIVRQIITLHGGTISVTSSDQMGTRFVVCLPCEERSVLAL